MHVTCDCSSFLLFRFFYNEYIRIDTAYIYQRILLRVLPLQLSQHRFPDVDVLLVVVALSTAAVLATHLPTRKALAVHLHTLYLLAFAVDLLISALPLVVRV